MIMIMVMMMMMMIIIFNVFNDINCFLHSPRPLARERRRISGNTSGLEGY